MLDRTRLALGLLFALFAVSAIAQTNAPSTQRVEWPTAWAPGGLGDLSAAALLDKPAGAAGVVAVRDGHFYSGDKRVRFWGVNFAFAACFPPHDRADAVADRLASLGVNAVRLHHMDMQKFPNGIFADDKGEQLSPDALDRLDYLVSALKQRGIYSDLNLHVSRSWSKSHGWPNADKLPESYDKMLDVFDPDLIAANKQYARDLLTHVNAYTKNRYADEPAVCFVEINNEDTLFLWGGEQALAKLPEPYASTLKRQWNDWLNHKYGSRDKLKAAWAAGELPLGQNVLRDAGFAHLGKDWIVEQHDKAKVTAAPIDGGVKLAVTAVDGTDWHLQFNQPGLKLEKGKFYTLTFTAQAEQPTKIDIAASQAHQPWQSLGLGATASVETSPKEFTFGFAASESDDDARLSFSVGHQLDVITISHPSLREGGRLGLLDGEDPSTKSVASHAPGAIETAARSADWFDFLQQTDERYWVGMHEFLKNDLGVKCPVTGTIGLGPLGTLSQSKMDFVDAHAYWDHPTFPHR